MYIQMSAKGLAEARGGGGGGVGRGGAGRGGGTVLYKKNFSIFHEFQ